MTKFVTECDECDSDLYDFSHAYSCCTFVSRHGRHSLQKLVYPIGFLSVVFGKFNETNSHEKFCRMDFKGK